MRVLITGGTGFVGQHLVKHLLNDGRYDLSLLVREAYSSGEPLPATIQPYRTDLHLVYADLRSFQLTSRALQEARPDAVIHLAARGATDPFLPLETALRHNLYGTLNLVRACFEKGRFPITHFLTARTPGELSHMNTYATSKLAAWDFCTMYAQNYGWPIMGAMIYQCYGPCQSSKTLVTSAMLKALAGDDFPMTAGTQQKDWIYVSDLVAAFGAMLEVDGLPPKTVFHLGSGQPRSVVDVVRLIYEVTESTGRPLVGALPTRPGETAVQQAPLSETLSRLPNWAPHVTLENGLKQLTQFYKSL